MHGVITETHATRLIVSDVRTDHFIRNNIKNKIGGDIQETSYRSKHIFS